MHLAFYKGGPGSANGSLFDKAIGLWTRSPYVHVECAFKPWMDADSLFIFNEKLRQAKITVMAGDPPARSWLCFSSSPRDGGTRFKWIDLTDGKWDLIEVPFLADERRLALLECAKLLGRKYDWGAIFGFVLPFGEHTAGRLMCSESGTTVVQNASCRRMLAAAKPWRTSPADLYALMKGLK
jgi:hypothetical protein